MQWKHFGLDEATWELEVSMREAYQFLDKNDIKLPMFNGNGLEDPEKQWFLIEVVWIVRQVQDEEIKV